MTSEELKARTKAFALRVIKLVDAMPRSQASQVIGKQLLRSATSGEQITGLHVEPSHTQSSPPSFPSWSKRRMKPFTGWSC
jgi:hypothetical protein